MASLTDPRACGPCTLCCTVLPTPALDKAAGTPCLHAAAGNCAIHAERPQTCRAFQCVWTVADGLDESWRPDVAGFVLVNPGDSRLFVETDPARPEAWRRQPYYDRIRAWSARTNPNYLIVMIHTAGKLTMVFPEDEIDLGPDRPNMRIDSGYEVVDGKRRPFAYYGAPAAFLSQ